ncbi:hypothetical protein LX32DRAFT_205678 [Colletotrichum zoysiae]|uniref:Uncharacterized protein n=1 Tax=Colletotrichum zoysiae TaxID=1216348 RepID=A0AAD9LU71_9PEZI|nr:hypothetical protein LX32DRAFT_205678 [Colletotrichum zoysiae]
MIIDESAVRYLEHDLMAHQETGATLWTPRQKTFMTLTVIPDICLCFHTLLSPVFLTYFYFLEVFHHSLVDASIRMFLPYF